MLTVLTGVAMVRVGLAMVHDMVLLSMAGTAAADNSNDQSDADGDW